MKKGTRNDKRSGSPTISPFPGVPDNVKTFTSGFLWLAAAILVLLFKVFTSCTSPRHIGRTGLADRLLESYEVSDAHVGIAIYDAGRKEYIYTHNDGKFFMPASNIKIPTLYAGLKYLGNGIPGIQYIEMNDTVFMRATGDPTFLLLDFPDQPVLRFMQDTEKPMVFIEPEWRTGALGHGWPWNFYLSYFMPERSPFPVYGNVIIWGQRDYLLTDEDVRITSVSSFPGLPWPVEIIDSGNEKFEVRRPLIVNDYKVFAGIEGDRDLFVPFATGGMQAALELLGDTLNKEIGLVPARRGLAELPVLPGIPGRKALFDTRNLRIIPDLPVISALPDHFTMIISRASGSLFRPMMLYSDNFYAEQTLLMVSNQLFGVMDEKILIEYLMENDLEGMPDKPVWVDGSGLSRYNLFTPRSLVWLLEKMKDEFGLEMICSFLPTGGEGTLEGFYLDEKGMIYAKTGTLSGNAVALSGFLVTQSRRTLIFSVLVNNHNKSADQVRRATESFLKEIIYKY